MILKKMNHSVEQYKVFMKKAGLFDMISKHVVNNLFDFALGIETGLDSNGRKIRDWTFDGESSRKIYYWRRFR